MNQKEATHLKYCYRTDIGGHLLEDFEIGKEYPITDYSIRAGFQVIINERPIWLSYSITKSFFKKLYKEG